MRTGDRHETQRRHIREVVIDEFSDCGWMPACGCRTRRSARAAQLTRPMPHRRDRKRRARPLHRSRITRPVARAPERSRLPAQRESRWQASSSPGGSMVSRVPRTVHGRPAAAGRGRPSLRADPGLPGFDRHRRPHHRVPRRRGRLDRRCGVPLRRGVEPLLHPAGGARRFAALRRRRAARPVRACRRGRWTPTTSRWSTPRCASGSCCWSARKATACTTCSVAGTPASWTWTSRWSSATTPISARSPRCSASRSAMCRCRPMRPARWRRSRRSGSRSRNWQPDAIVLARFMQVVPPELCAAWEGRLINIHHGFLPSFRGARPYHQAYARGVKLIGATCHYVTAELDAGSDHRAGRDPRRPHRLRRGDGPPGPGHRTGRAVPRAHRHLEDRVLVDGLRTIVFR